MLKLSLIPRPEGRGQRERDGPHMGLIVVEFHRLRILLIYFHMLVAPILILGITLSIDLSWQHIAGKETHRLYSSEAEALKL